MPPDWVILMALGGLFILLGIVAILWGRHEEQSYYHAITTRRDLREFLVHWPPRIEPGALKVGGWIAIVVGLVVLGLGSKFWLGK